MKQSNYKFFVLFIAFSFLGCENFLTPNVETVRTDGLFKIFGTSFGDDEGIDIVNTSDGGYMIWGSIESSSSLGSGGHDFLLLKIDSLGNEEAEYIFGTERDNQALQIEALEDGTFLLLGSSTVLNSEGEEDTKIYLAQRNADGSSIWAKTLSEDPATYNWEDEPVRMAKVDATNYVIIANTDSEKNRAGNLNENIRVIKYNTAYGTADSAIVWQKIYGGDGHDYAGDIHYDASVGYTLFGTLGTVQPSITQKNSKLLLLQLNELGDLITSHPNITELGENETGKRIVQRPSDGSFILMSNEHSTNNTVIPHFFNFNRVGSDLSLVTGPITFTGEEMYDFLPVGGVFKQATFSDIVLLDDQSLLIGGVVNQAANSNNPEIKDLIFIMKTNINGEIQWAKNMVSLLLIPTLTST